MDSSSDSGHETVMCRLDLPPVWLLLHALAAWAVARLEPGGLSFGGAWADFAAGGEPGWPAIGGSAGAVRIWNTSGADTTGAEAALRAGWRVAGLPLLEP